MNDAAKCIWDNNDHLLETDDLDDDCPNAGEDRPRIEPGEYIAFCHGTKVINYYGERKLMIQFRLCGGRYDGLELFLPCPFPRGARSYRTKYYKQWVIANGARPERGQRMPRSVFVNKKFRILVGDSKRRFDNGELMPKFLQYSIVTSILGGVEDDVSN